MASDVGARCRVRSTLANLPEWVNRLASVGLTGSESDEERVAKMSLTLLGWASIPSAAHVALVMAYLGVWEVAALAGAFVAVASYSLARLARDRDHRGFMARQAVATLLFPGLAHSWMGGFVMSGGILLWAVFAPLAYLLQGSRRLVVRTWIVYWLMILTSIGYHDPHLVDSGRLTWEQVALVASLHIVGVSVLLLATIAYFDARWNRERARSERLLLNILPAPVAERLKRREGPIADHFEEVTILFADLVGFTELSRTTSPEALVEMLNDVFRRFDTLASAHGLEKIKTIGDAYMVVGGLPEPRADHAAAAARLALAMRQAVVDYNTTSGGSLQLRIGLHSGPAVAGVIGLHKFAYDLWGDSVNTASRMESHGVPGEIHVSEVTRGLLGEGFQLRARGEIEVKGKGAMETYFLEERL